MSDYETPPPVDADRTITDFEDAIDPEAPTDSTLAHPPRDDADRLVSPFDDPDDVLQEDNADTSFDQPSDQAT